MALPGGNRNMPGQAHLVPTTGGALPRPGSSLDFHTSASRGHRRHARITAETCEPNFGIGSQRHPGSWRLWHSSECPSPHLRGTLGKSASKKTDGPRSLTLNPSQAPWRAAPTVPLVSQRRTLTLFCHFAPGSARRVLASDKLSRVNRSDQPTGLIVSIDKIRKQVYLRGDQYSYD
jgi:hypothetical protein